MRTSVVAGTVTALTTLRVSAFSIPAGTPRLALQATAHHSFCSAPAASSVFSSDGSARSWARHSKRPRVGGSARRRSSASLSMFDATDLFQLQQWAGDISATEVLLLYHRFSGPVVRRLQSLTPNLTLWLRPTPRLMRVDVKS